MRHAYNLEDGDYAEHNGFSVEVEGDYLIVSDATGNSHEVGPPEDDEHAAELIEDAIKSFAFTIATQLMKELKNS